jgi:hypothetical protein
MVRRPNSAMHHKQKGNAMPESNFKSYRTRADLNKMEQALSDFKFINELNGKIAQKKEPEVKPQHPSLGLALPEQIETTVMTNEEPSPSVRLDSHLHIPNTMDGPYGSGVRRPYKKTKSSGKSKQEMSGQF